MDWIKYAIPGDHPSGSSDKRCISGPDIEGGLLPEYWHAIFPTQKYVTLERYLGPLVVSAVGADQSPESSNSGGQGRKR